MTRLALISLVLFVTMTALAHEQFCIAKDGKAATIVVDENDWKGVIRAANDLSDDIRKVMGVSGAVRLIDNGLWTIDNSIIVGTIGKSRTIDRLIKQKKLDVKKIKGHWEGYVIDVVDGNLVIAGNDKRGTIYGIWIINVGDLKPKEMPISFIMDYAWDPESVGAGDEQQGWLRQWTRSVLGGCAAEDVKEAADIIADVVNPDNNRYSYFGAPARTE